jgi:hypothetical protein
VMLMFPKMRYGGHDYTDRQIYRYVLVGFPPN